MLQAIAGKEFLQMARDGRFRVVTLLMLALLLLSLFAGARHHRSLRTERERAAQVQRDQWLTQGEKGPHAAAHFGVYAFKPSGSLALVDRGVNAYAGSMIWLEPHKQNSFRDAPAQDSTSLLRFGELTTAFVLQTALPLLIITLTFGAFAGERERGTLRLAAAQGVRMETLALGKALGIAGALGLLLVPAAICGAATLVLGGAVTRGSGSDLVPRTLLLALSYLLYFGITLFLSLAVSAWARTARLALLFLLGGWVAATLIAPRLVADAAKRLYPTPSSVAFAEKVKFELAGAGDAHNESDQRMERLKQETLKQYGVQDLKDLPVAFEGISLQAGEDWGYPVFDRNYNALDAQFSRQEAVCETAGYVLPFLSIRSLSAGLSGTDRRAHEHFARATEVYRRTLIRIINDDVKYHAKTGDTGYTNGRALYEKVPVFAYKPLTVSDLRDSFRMPLLALAAGFFTTAAVAVFSARKQRILP
ncbi:MAG: DUF3526 domain-containing protein [Cytophagales bacterium]|nr:DUF3526 domain-containing protein [Armatimonadota bacterium]